MTHTMERELMNRVADLRIAELMREGQRLSGELAQANATSEETRRRLLARLATAEAQLHRLYGELDATRRWARAWKKAATLYYAVRQVERVKLAQTGQRLSAKHHFK